MKELRYLELGQVLRLHLAMVEGYGGDPGLRDVGVLVSSIEQPRAGVSDQRLHADLFEMAAAYLYHIVLNHPFIDGNKRTGAASAVIFLELNGVEIEADEDGLVDLTLRTAMGQVEKQEIAAWFRARVTEQG